MKKVVMPQGEETYTLCRTAGRREKEKAIRKRFSNRMEEALERLAKTIEAGRLKDRNKMERRLGRIQASHPQVNDLYEVTLRDTAEGVRLQWGLKEDRQFGAGCGKVLTCCGLICSQIQPKNSGLVIAAKQCV